MAEIAKARIGAVKDFEATLDTKLLLKKALKKTKKKELAYKIYLILWRRN